MTETDDQLSQEESDRILYEQIIPDHRLDDVMAYNRPKAIIVVGQPGACTAELVRAAFVELTGDAIVIAPEDLADYHPRVREFRREDPYTWSSRTATDASTWALRLLGHTASLLRHVIFDISCTDGSLLVPVLIRRMKERGYTVEVRVTVAHRLESEISLHARFTGGLENEGYGRYISKAVHDSAYELLPERLDAIHGR